MTINAPAAMMLAFYVMAAEQAGVPADRLGGTIQADMLEEEIAKYQAARRIWAREMRETFVAEDPKSWLMRTHAQTAGVSLTA
jgi:methylmalonyl-CoA mutase N-terminal domain/subunit